jgi:adenylate cyclase
VSNIGRPEIAAIADWLIDGARSAAAPQQVLAVLCERLVAAGVPLWRAAVFVRTLHPEVAGRRFIWRQGENVGISDLPYEGLQQPEYRDGIFLRVVETAAPVRRRLDAAPGTADSAVLAQLREQGATDYVASPLVFSDGTIHAATWATKQPGGFAEEEIAAIEAIVTPLARVAEIRAAQRVASTLLDAYVGHNAGERILSGRIRRGDTEAIQAAIWLSDMRGFTALADRLPPAQLTELLNRYFDCQIPGILERGGEVLKFIGDGLLAIFPIGGDADIAASCAAGLAAALEARAAIADLPVAERVRFGLGLHVGEVLYGNIGSGNRLDFTCIGPAVNLVARLEKLAGRLGRTVLGSAAFAVHSENALMPIGAFRLPGIRGAQRVFGLDDEG